MAPASTVRRRRHAAAPCKAQPLLTHDKRPGATPLACSSRCPLRPPLLLALLLCCMGPTPFSRHTSAAALATASDCQAIADTYFDHHHREPLPYDGANMAYFLHVPRTAGRTFHTCFLKMGVPVRRQCPNTYDHLRINVTVPNCYLLSSHDDFSVVSLLPDNVAVMSHIRDPVERFLSAYEFAVEVASRTFQRSGPPPRKDPRRIATEDVWPWSFLVPFFAKDMRERREQLLQEPQASDGSWIKVTQNKSTFFFNKRKDVSKWTLSDSEAKSLLPPLDAYSNPLAMSLEEFADHPIAQELLHNGQTYQVLGITNYSHWGDAPHMRECMGQNTMSWDHLQRLAIERLGKFFHVGVTDRLADSVAAAAVAMRFSMQQVTRSPKATGSKASVAPSLTGGRPAAGDLILRAGEVKALQNSIQQSLQELQAMKEQLFESNAQGHIGPEKDAMDTKIREARTLLMAQQARLTQLTDKKQAQQGSGNVAAASDAAGTLGLEFLKCARNAQVKNLERRVRSFSHVFMMDGRSIAFTREARKAIPERVLHKIRDHNPMDVALHAEAERLLTQRRQQWAQEGKLEELPQVRLPPIPEMVTQMAYNIPLPKAGEAPTATGHQDSL